jgi:receptor protein-tyrosine kinase
MTDDKRTLNLIERAAKRLADSDARPESQPSDMRQAPQATASLIARVGERIGREDAAAAPELGRPVVVQPVQPVQPAQPMAPIMSERTSAAAEPAPRPAAPAAVPPANQVRLDFRALRQNGMITPDNMVSGISNEYRAIKRRLMQKVRDPQTRSTVNNLVMVTSSLPGEGKTFSSVNLAMSLAAERGLQVLLIDADVIKPSVGNVFINPSPVGLTDYLTGRVTRISQVLHRCVEVPNLSVIFAGKTTNDGPELLSSGRMAELCREMSARYPDRVVVLDTSPVLASAEPAVLANYVHHAIMVVASNHAARYQVRRALESIATCRNVSLLFNKAPEWNEAEYMAYYSYTAQPAAS